MTDYKALCAELVHGWTEGRDIAGPMANARTALAQPEPEGVTDKALASFTAYFCRNYPGPDTIIHKPEWHAPKIFHAATAALARFARPAIEPEGPISESELAAMWNQQADAFNQWDSLDSGEQLAWAQARALARPAIEPVPDTKARELLNLLLDDLDALIDDSEGVAGLHLNGDIACWESLRQGGRFETWLMRMDEARAFLDSTMDRPAGARPAIEPVPVADLPPRVGHVLRLAEIIREVDGNHDKGAAALAEAILSHAGSMWRPAIEPEGVTLNCDEIDVPWLYRGDDFHVYKEGYTAGWAEGARAAAARYACRPKPPTQEEQEASAAELSPAAQAVLNAAGTSEPGIYATIAAALCAAADQVMAGDTVEPLGDTVEDCIRGAEREYMRGKFYSIATELEGHAPTS